MGRKIGLVYSRLAGRAGERFRPAVFISGQGLENHSCPRGSCHLRTNIVSAIICSLGSLRLWITLFTLYSIDSRDKAKSVSIFKTAAWLLPTYHSSFALSDFFVFPALLLATYPWESVAFWRFFHLRCWQTTFNGNTTCLARQTLTKKSWQSSFFSPLPLAVAVLENEGILGILMWEKAGPRKKLITFWLCEIRNENPVDKTMNPLLLTQCKTAINHADIIKVLATQEKGAHLRTLFLRDLIY